MSRVVGVVGGIVWVYFQPGNPNAWAFLASQVYGANEDRKVRRDRRRAIASYNAAQKDRLEMSLYDAYQARTLVMGRTRHTEGRRGRFIQSGTNLEKLSFFVSIAGHEIDAIEKVYIFDDEVTLDGSGWVQPTAVGTASGYTTSGTALAVGATSIPLITGSGTVVAGDWVQFAGDATRYKVATGISSPGTIVLAAPGLRRAIAASATACTLYKAPYASTARSGKFDTGTADGSGNATITLTGTPVAGTVYATWSLGAGQSLTQGTPSFSISGSTCTVTGAQAGSDVTIAYEVETLTSYVRMRPYLGTDTQSVAGDVASEYGGKMRTTDHYRGMAGWWIDLTYSPDVFPQGIPTFSAVIRGAKVYDPRKDSTNGGSGAHRLATKSTWEWTENPELHFRHYARWYAGLALPDADQPWADVISEADVCGTSTTFTLEQVDAALVLALNGEGANGGTTVTDSSNYAHSGTVAGVTTSTAQFKVGAASLLFNASGTSVTWAATAEWLFGNSDFTLEAWIYPTSVDATRRSIFDFRFDGSSSGTSWALDFVSGAGGLRFQIGTGALNSIAGGTVAANTWQHVAAVRDGNNMRLYLDGVQVASATLSGAVNGPTGGSVPAIGRRSGSQNYGGYMDRVAVYSRCLYPSGATFTPPVTALTANLTTTTSLPRYQCGIAISSDMDRQAALDAIVETMAGRWAWHGGQLRSRAGHMKASSFTIDETWIVQPVGADGEPEPTDAPVRGTRQVPRENRINRVTGRFTDPDQRYQQLPFVAVQDDTLVAAKGPRPTEIEFEGVNQHAQAQNLARIAIREANAGFTLDLGVGFRAMKLDLLDVGTVNLAKYGITGKTCELVASQLAYDRPGRIKLREITAAIFDPAAPLDGRDPAPDSTARPPWQVPAVAGLAVTSGTTAQTDGSILVRTVVSWTAVADEVIRKGGDIEVQYTEATGTLPTGDWASWTEVGTATQAIIPGLLAGRFYYFKVRAVQRTPLVRGTFSPWYRVQIAARPTVDTVGISADAVTKVFTSTAALKSQATILAETGITVFSSSGLYAAAEFTLDGTYQCLVTVNYRLSNTFGSAAQGYSLVAINKDNDSTDYGFRTWTRTVAAGDEIDEAYTVTSDFTLGPGQHVVGLRYTGKVTAHTPSYSNVPPQDVYLKVEVIKR